MNTIEIKRWDNGNVIFSYTCEDNTVSKTVEKAVRQGINLSYANLSYANLIGADLTNTNLTFANLSYANLSNSDLYHTNFFYTNLSYANLSNTNISFTRNFAFSNLNGTNLTNANLTNVNLSFTNLSTTILDNVKGCPKEGSFIAWKKCFLLNEDGDDVDEEFIVKLEIPADAKRSSATTNKCRCNKAKVLEIQYLDGTPINLTCVYSYFNIDFIYKVGEIVESDSFDDRFWLECSHGIHFFMNREDAVNYFY